MGRKVAAGRGSSALPPAAECLEARTFLSATASISGVVFDDHNANGIRDKGDEILAHVSVFDDLKHTGVYAKGDPVTTTNAAGAYSFAHLNPGAYVIGQVVPAGYRQAFPFGSAEYTIALANGQAASAKNFGDTTSSRVSGYVYENLNAAGTGAGETGIGFVKVLVTPKGATSPVYTAVTNSAGYYVVGNLPHTSYTVTLQPPPGYTLTNGTAVRTTAYLGSGQTADNVNFLGKLSTPIVYDSAKRFVSVTYQIDSYYFPNPGYSPVTQTANSSTAFNGNVTGGKDTGEFTNPEVGMNDIAVFAGANQKSTLTTTAITDNGSVNASEGDYHGGGTSFSAAESYFQTTFTVYAPLKFSASASVSNSPGVGASASFSLVTPDGVVFASEIVGLDGFTINKSGTLGPGTYTLTLDMKATDNNDNLPATNDTFNLKFG